MDELSEYFGGARALGKIQADDSFRDWFKEMSEAVDSLSFNDENFAGISTDLIKYSDQTRYT
jgi:hypothetical protein